MEQKKYSVTTSIDVRIWDNFLLHHPNGNIFQTRYMFEVYKGTKNYFPVKLFAIDTNTNELCGILSSVTIYEIGGILKRFSSHSVIQGGPVVKPGLEQLIIPLLMSKLDKESKGKALYSESRNMHDVKDVFQDVRDYQYEDHLDYLIKLDQSEKELWHQIHQSRRKNINRAQRAGIEIEEMPDNRLLPVFYNLLKETYEEVKIPLVDKTLFEQACNILVPNNLCKIFLAKYNDTYIGCRAVLVYNNLIYDWYAGARKDSLEFYPNDYLVWHILRWGIQNHYTCFDFGGAGKPNVEYGPREFKRRFGGELVNFGRNVKIYSPFKMSIARTGFKILRNIQQLKK